MSIAMIHIFTVSWDDPSGTIQTKGFFKGRVKRMSRTFGGRTAKASATKFAKTVAILNPKIKEQDALVF